MSLRSTCALIPVALLCGPLSSCVRQNGGATLEPLERRTLLAAQAYDWYDATIKANGFIDGIVYSPASPDVVYIHTDMGGAYRWDRGAARWRPLNDWSRHNDWAPQNLGVETMAVDPADPNRVYMAAGTYMSPTAILRSSDGGRTWLRTDVAGINSNGNGSARNAGERLAVDPNLPSILLYGTRDDGLWKSSDSGATWTRLTSFPTVGQDSGFTQDTGIVWVLFDKSSSTNGNATQRIYAGVVVATAGEARIYRSTNAGASWEALPGGQPTTANYFPQRAALTPDGDALYLTYGRSTTYPGPHGITGGFAYKVASPGEAAPTWTNVTPPGVGTNWGFSAVALDPTDPSTVYVGELNNYNPADRIWRSTNGGASWTAISPNANRDNSSAPYVNSLGVHWLGDLQIDPFNRDVAIFTTGMGLYRTTNLTSSNPLWTFFNDGFEQSAVLELSSPRGGDVHLLSAIGDRDGYRHVDFSQSPAIGRHGQNNGLARGTSDDIDTAWDDANVVVRTVRSSPFVQYSNDNGVTWNWFPSTGASGSTGSANTIAISADGTKAVYEPGGSGTIRHSTRSGSAWGAWVTSGITNPPANGAKVVAELVAGSRTFYAYQGTSVWRSTDGGQTWTTMTTAAPTGGEWIRAVPDQAGHLLMSRRENGLWRSTDGGATWTRLAQSLVTAANVVGVGAGATPQSYPSIYVGGVVGGQTGFFRSDDQGASWTMISDAAHQFGWVTVIQGDPRVHGRLYVGTNGRGIQVADIHQGPTALPGGWNTQDIGSPANAGAAGESGGKFELTGGGAGIAGTSDQFRFAYQPLIGDGAITARVLTVPNGSPGNYDAKAGVMIRSSLDAGSAHALVALTPGSVNGAVFQTRTSGGGATGTIASHTTNVFPPYWVRLTRAGNVFTADTSPDGTTWTQLAAPQTIAMGANVYVGLAVTASNANELNISTFDNVSIPADTVRPTVQSSAFEYRTAPNALRFGFSEDVSASLALEDLLVTGAAGTVVPTGMTWDAATNTATFALPTPLDDGNFAARLLAAGITDPAGNALAEDYVLDFFSLLGDANHDGRVNLIDFNTLATNFGQPNRDFSHGDFNYDGTVNLIDFNVLAGRFGASVPPSSASRFARDDGADDRGEWDDVLA